MSAGRYISGLFSVLLSIDFGFVCSLLDRASS